MSQFPTGAAPAPVFTGLDGAEVQERRPDIPEGTHLLTIESCKLFQAREAGQSFVVNATTQEGLSVAWKQFGIDQAGDSGQLKRANIKAFFAAVLGLDPSAPPAPGRTWDEVASGVVAGDGTALAGRQVVVQAQRATARSGNAFTKCAFTSAPAPGQAG